MGHIPFSESNQKDGYDRLRDELVKRNITMNED